MPIAPDLSGRALDDRYELHAVIGEGAFGRVYSGWDRRLERTVAVKIIKPWWAEDPDWAPNFEREARLLARISHPGIVQIFDVGKADECLYYVSELIDGESLAARLKRGPIEPWEAAAIAEQLCKALAQAHTGRVIHRDVKPANILIASDGRVKVGDFGVARLAEGSTDGASATIVGTPRYMAPEQARGRRATPATDVYSVGVVLYEMLAGRPPFTEHSAVELALKHLHDAPPRLPARTPRKIDAIVGRALAKEPSKRYADGAAMADALDRALAARPGARRGATGRTRARATRRRAISEQPPALVTTGGPTTSSLDDPPPPRRPPARRPSGSHPATSREAGAGAPPPGSPPPGSRPPSSQARGPERRDEPTRRAPKLHPRRNLNPAARRRSIAALTGAFLLLGAMITAALVIGSTAHVKVPTLLGMTRVRAQARASRLGLQTDFKPRYDSAPKGTTIAQRPRPKAKVTENTTIRVWFSAGPPPVRVPELAGEQLTDAQAKLAQIGLKARATVIAAPGVPAGTITSQSPAPGSKLAPPKRVSVHVAEVPQWRPITSLTGSGQTTSAQFRVRGARWRIVYTMGFQGTCTFIFFCSGPHAEVDNVRSGATVDTFGLSDGGRQTRTFNTGAGAYDLTVSPGDDTARWQVWVEDYY
jgi:eukaryotic-like serine/threonine-protein kinase